jgi:hypothetical protein
MDYTSAKDLLEEHATRIKNGHGVVAQLDHDVKRLANKTQLTYVERASEGIAQSQPAYRVVLFGNPILHFWEGDYFTISDHGWFSATTIQRLNEYMPKGFRIYGETPKGLEMETRRPLGFVHTPNGTYPYNMPAVFRYDGTPYGESFTAEAHTAVSELGSYTNQYLDLLLGHKDCDYIGEGRVQGDLSLGTTGHNSCMMADAILRRKYYSHLVELAVEQHANVAYAGLTLKEIVTVLLAEGARAFKVNSSEEAKANHLEHMIKHRLPIPTINQTWIRRTLRPLINEFVILTLGFDYVTWNRREPR